MKKRKVAVLGATGMVGQKFILLLQNHPWFEIAALGASNESMGKSYDSAVETKWKQDCDVPATVAGMEVIECNPELMDVDFAFSGLDSEVAGPIEKSFAEAGVPVISNTKNHRMEEDVPLLIPEVNPDHVKLIDIQRKQRKWKGFIITNPNCVVIPLAMVLKPVLDHAGISGVSVVSMQAVSGAGFPGVASLDIVDNVIPQIDGEEPKVESEPKKVLGMLKKRGVRFADFPISAQCNRVAVQDGHLLNVSFSTVKKTNVEAIKEWLRHFHGVPQTLKLPSAPVHPIVYLEDGFRPQPKLDRTREGGMAVTVGRLRECPVFGFKMVILGHNTIRGAAGAAILNAELLYKKGYL